MISRARRHRVVIGVLLLLVTIVLVRETVPDPPAEQPGRPSNPAGRGGRGGRGANTEDIARLPPADVRIEALQQVPGELAPPERNPFRFAERPPPPPPPAPKPVAPPPRMEPLPPPMPVGPPPPPRIPLRYIGVIDERGPRGPIGVFSDTRGGVFQGREGDIIEGRYRVRRIGNESADLEYLDGRGRQTIGMTGQ